MTFARAAAAQSALLALLTSAVASAAPRSITLAEAIDLGLRDNLELRSSGLTAERARIAARGALGELGPRLRVDANLTEWNDRYLLDIGGSPFLVRDAFTATVTLSGIQPLGGLYPRIERYRAGADERSAAEGDVSAARADLVFRATESYLQLLLAVDVQQIAIRTVEESAAQAEKTRALVANGKLIDADLLRTEVALAQARQDELAAEAEVAIARATLATVVGLPVDSELEPERIDLERLPPLPARLDGELDGAQRDRPEIRAAQARERAARSGAQAAIGDLLPSVDLTFGYQRTDGQAFFPRNAGYVAGVIGWDFWAWGARYAALEIERTRTAAAAVAVSGRRRDVALEVTTRFVTARSARAAVDVARAAVGQAEEVYRTTTVLYENGRATTTDLLAAQLAEARARTGATRSAYRYLSSHAALVRAVGEKARAR